MARRELVTNRRNAVTQSSAAVRCGLRHGDSSDQAHSDPNVLRALTGPNQSADGSVGPGRTSSLPNLCSDPNAKVVPTKGDHDGRYAPLDGAGLLMEVRTDFVLHARWPWSSMPAQDARRAAGQDRAFRMVPEPRYPIPPPGVRRGDAT